MDNIAQRLPVWLQAEEIRRVATAMPSGGFLVLRAEPGSGKTSIVPYLLAESISGMILVSEPRRLAAIGAAQFAAKLLGQAVGEKVGYAVRGDKKWGPATRVLYVTEGLALNLLSDPSFMDQVSYLIIDEFHERHAATDSLIVLARLWSRMLIQKNLSKQMRFVLMSATFDANKYSAMFEPMQSIDISGKVFPISVRYEPLEDIFETKQNSGSTQFAPWRLPSYWNAVASVAVREARALQAQEPGHHVLCFLPGKGEIARVRAEIQSQLQMGKLGEPRPMDSSGSRFSIEELHGDRPINQLLDAVFRQDEQVFAGQTIIFLATNIAESSVTLPGVRAVIDTGLMRIAKHHLASGTQELSMAKIGQNSAGQRAGRAAREGPGKAIRLYSETDFFKRPNETAPEICISDLSRDLLDLARVTRSLAALAVSRDSLPGNPFQISATPEAWAALPWVDVPPAERLEAALAILRGTGCFDCEGNVTAAGFRIGGLPFPVRLGAVLLSASEGAAANADLPLGVVAAACALISEGDIVDAAAAHDSDEQNELVTQYLALRSFILGNKQLHDFHRRIARVAHSLRVSLSFLGFSATDPRDLAPAFPAQIDSKHLGKIFFSGYFDAVAKSSGQRALEHMNGEIYDAPCARTAGFYLVLDGVRIHGAASRSAARKIATKILPLDTIHLLDGPAEYLTENESVEQSGLLLRVRNRLCYGGLIIEDDLLPTQHPGFLRSLTTWLTQSAVNRIFTSGDFVELLKRMKLCGSPELDACAAQIQNGSALAERLAMYLSEHCVQSSTSLQFSEETLASPTLEHWLLESHLLRTLRQLSPNEVRLANGMLVRVSYAGDQPTLTGKIQEFYGLKAHPRLALQGSNRAFDSAPSGQSPLSIVLLAPGGQTAQITADLALFWKNSYPEIRKAYAGRYPRHHWPDDPASARPLLTKRQVAASESGGQGSTQGRIVKSR